MNYRKIVYIKQEPLTFSVLPLGSWNLLKEMIGEDFGLLDFYYLDGDIYLSEEILEKLKNLFVKHPQKIKSMLKLLNKHNLDFINFCENHKMEKDLESSLNEFMNFYNNFGANALILIALEDALNKIIKDNLILHYQKELGENQLREIIRILSANVKESNVLKEKKDLLRLAYDFDEEKLKNHLEKYSWMNCKFLNYTPYTEKDVFNRISCIQDPLNELEKIDKNSKFFELEFKKLILEFENNPNLLEIIDSLQTLTFLRTNRVEAINYGCFKIYWLLKEVANVLKIEHEKVSFLLLDEILCWLKTGKSVDVEQRMEGYALVAQKGKIELFTGDKIQEIKKDFEIEINKKEIKGAIASRGIAQGIVKVIYDKNEISKLNSKEILVTPMTTPDFVVAMEKAGAIVTDLGGLTSHAAIVAREMGVPCIVGTENATEVLKDGDLVVVDADNGKVRKVA